MASDPRLLAQALQATPNAQPTQRPLFGLAMPHQSMMQMPQMQQQQQQPFMPSGPEMWKAMGRSPFMNGGQGSAGNAFMPSQAFMNNQWGY